MIFLTVGTELPFERLVKAVDEIAADGTCNGGLFAQIGNGHYKPRHMPWVGMLEGPLFKQRLRECDAIISHAGIGTVINAIEFRKPVLIVPRLKRYGEHVNDHQLETARRLDGVSGILVAYDTCELPGLLRELPNSSCPGADAARLQSLAACIKGFLDGFRRPLS